MYNFKSKKLFKKQQDFRIKYFKRLVLLLIIICSLSLTGVLIVLDSNLQNPNQDNISNLDRSSNENANSYPKLNKEALIGSDTVFYPPTLNQPQPTPSQNQAVSVSIFDVDNIENASIFYKYPTINQTTEYNVSMSSTYGSVTSFSMTNNAAYNQTNYIDNNGTISQTATNYRTGTRTFEPSPDKLLDNNY